MDLNHAIEVAKHAAAVALSVVGSIRVALIPFAGPLNRWIADKLNDVARKSVQDDDDYLRGLFSARWYKFVAVALFLMSVHLPSLADLERAIKLQREAVAAASPPGA